MRCAAIVVMAWVLWTGAYVTRSGKDLMPPRVPDQERYWDAGDAQPDRTACERDFQRFLAHLRSRDPKGAWQFDQAAMWRKRDGGWLRVDFVCLPAGIVPWE